MLIQKKYNKLLFTGNLIRQNSQGQNVNERRKRNCFRFFTRNCESIVAFVVEMYLKILYLKLFGDGSCSESMRAK